MALRGVARGQSYCSCPDFRRNHLGTCKHILRVLRVAGKKHGDAAMQKPWKPAQIAIHARYDGTLRLAVDIPSRLKPALKDLLDPWRGREVSEGTGIRELFDLVRSLSRAGDDYVIYPDAEEFLNAELHKLQLADMVREIRKNPAAHPLRKTLLHAELLPYQLDGIAFAAGKGRAVLADEMGLGKTIQGVGVAEFLAQHAGLRRVLVICPASLKSQWRNEIHKFSGRSVQLVGGKLAERAVLYQGEAFFTVCNYEQVLRDYLEIERSHWDLIILDEAQRIKNWEAKTSRVIKSLRSRFALVLTGTPLENRLEILLGAKPEPAVDVSTAAVLPAVLPDVSAERKDLIAAASGQLATSALTLLGASLGKTEADAKHVQQIRDNLSHCVEIDAQGRRKLSLHLPDAGSLDQIAKALALLVQG